MYKIDFFKINNLINVCMKATFNFSIIFFTIILIFSLVLWLIGIKIKSEKVIKMGVKISISVFFIEMLLIIVVLIIAEFK